MKKNLFRTLLMILSLLPLSVGAQTFDYSIEIDVSPNVLNIESSGTVVTIHTNIGYSLVVGSSCTLNGIEIDYWKSDNRGYFVAKFDIDAVKNLPLNLNQMNTLTMTGEDKYGKTFMGSQEIKVVRILPKVK